MNFKLFLEELKEAQENLEVFEKKESKLVQEEVKFLHKLAKEVYPFASKKAINGQECLLVYVFAGDKEWISKEAYLTSEGNIVYQVYDEEKYRGFVRDANIKDGFVHIKAEKFLVHVPLKEIFQFFLERPDFLYECAEEKSKKNNERQTFLQKINQIL